MWNWSIDLSPQLRLGTTIPVNPRSDGRYKTFSWISQEGFFLCKLHHAQNNKIRLSVFVLKRFHSSIQLFIDATLDSDWSAITGNPVKLYVGFLYPLSHFLLIASPPFFKLKKKSSDSGLSGLSIVFDIIFIVQHYVLYTDREDTTIEAKRLRSPDVEVQAAAGSGQSTSERTSLLPHA